MELNLLQNLIREWFFWSAEWLSDFPSKHGLITQPYMRRLMGKKEEQEHYSKIAPPLQLLSVSYLDFFQHRNNVIKNIPRKRGNFFTADELGLFSCVVVNNRFFAETEQATTHHVTSFHMQFERGTGECGKK